MTHSSRLTTHDPSTIVALATAPGLGAIAIVRVAGEDAFAVAQRIAPSADPSRPRIAQLCTIVRADGQTIDHALVTCFPAPHSFTGEDTVECSVHGGALVATQVIAAALEAGARLAEPGEFTRRAVLNGKLDLVQAEAVGDLIASTAPGQATVALHQLDGGLSRRIAALRESVVAAQALLTYALDFPEEDDGPVAPERPLAAVEEIRAQLEALLATAADGERVRQGALVVLIGPPNVGKSSLFNALLGQERALVAELPGTTRDAIEADVTLEGWPARLVDTAGLRDASDPVEMMGVAVSKRYLDAADIVLYCNELPNAPQINESPFSEDSRIVTVVTKSDLLVPEDRSIPDYSFVSAFTGSGLAELRALLARRLFSGVRREGGDTPLLTRARHRVAVGAASTAVERAAEELQGGEIVLAAHQLQEAVLALDTLIGVVDREEVFDRVFAGFCIGK